MNLQSKKGGHVADITVIVNRSDLWDSAAHFVPDENHQHNHPHTHVVAVAPYYFAPDNSKWTSTDQDSCVKNSATSVAVVRVPYSFQNCHPPPPQNTTVGNDQHHTCDVIDTTIPNPHDPSAVHDKYWAQRRRLFSRFDKGIQLDSEGWYSVTPEIIADHVAHRVAEIAESPAFSRPETDPGIVILDAFCGCGGNSIAFGKIPSRLISKVVCVDMDRSRLLKAAHNAAIYDIPRDKLVFVECNSIFILQHCYKNGEFVLDRPTDTPPTCMPPPVMPTTYAGYQVGGLDMLPPHIDAVFMDPPWGGVDYEVLGKNGYDLIKNMKIQVGPEAEWKGESEVSDDFFDTFSTPHTNMSQKARKANFNKKTDGEFINGMELLKLAAEATSSRVVVYDMPRNTNKTSLGKCALGAGYRGNIKLEEHHLNGRLKTVTAYLGSDYSSLLQEQEHGSLAQSLSGDEFEA